MASCNLSCYGSVGIFGVEATVTDLTGSGNTRLVNVKIGVTSNLEGTLNAVYSVGCIQSSTAISGQSFSIGQTQRLIFNETFYVTVGNGETAEIYLEFTISAGGLGSLGGTITRLDLRKEAVVTASTVSCASSATMGGQVLIRIDRSRNDVTHNLYYDSGAGMVLMASNVGSSYSWTVPDMADKCDGATSGVTTIRCVTYLNGNWVGENTCSLTLHVPSYSDVSVDGNSTEMGGTKIVSFPRNSANFTVVLTMEWQGGTTELTRGKINSYSWTPGYDLAKSIPDLTYGTATLRCETYNGNAKVGESRTSVTVKVPNNDITKPKITGVQTSVVSKLSGALAGVYIRGLSGVKVETAASSEYSRISKYDVYVGRTQASGNPATVQTIPESGNVLVSVTVTDARGYSTTLSTQIAVLNYSEPSVLPCSGEKDVVCGRAKADGTLSSEGTYLAIRAKKSFTSLAVDGAEQNGCTLQYRYKAGSGSFGSWVTISSYMGAAETKAVYSNVVSSTTTSYVVELRAVDKIGNQRTLSFQIATEHVSFALYDGEDGAAFGKWPEEPHVVDIAEHMILKVRGKLDIPLSVYNLGCNSDVTWLANVAVSRLDSNPEPVAVVEGRHAWVFFHGKLNTAIKREYNGLFYYVNVEGKYLSFWYDRIPANLRPPSGGIYSYASYCSVKGMTILLKLFDNSLMIAKVTLPPGEETSEYPNVEFEAQFHYFV